MCNEFSRNTNEIENPAHNIRLWNATQINEGFQTKVNFKSLPPLVPLDIVNNQININQTIAKRLVLSGQSAELQILYQGILDFSRYKFAADVSSDLLAAVNANLDGENYIGITETQQEEKIWEGIDNTYTDPNGNSRRIFELGTLLGRIDLLRKLQGKTPLRVFEYKDLEGIIPTEATEEYERFEFDTRLSGVKISYFFPTGQDIATISIVISHI